MTQHTDILIVGGGIAGKCAAIGAGIQGRSVVCVDPAQGKPKDGRTTAYLQPAQAMLTRMGVWEKIEPHSAALHVMRIADASTTPPIIKDFKAEDISPLPFGWNVANERMHNALDQRLKALSNVQILKGAAAVQIIPRSTGALIHLSNGQKWRSRLMIAADGRASTVREALQIVVHKTDFAQSALSFTVCHDAPHDNISTEIHQSGGPFTLVPLPDYKGRPCSAVVWMEHQQNAQMLVDLPAQAFQRAVNVRSAGIMGHLSVVTKPSAWPIISQIAERFYGPRTALIAEAAHVLPPIGAQGLNLSLADIQTLLELTQNADDAGAQALLHTYHQKRWAAAKARVLGIGILNRTSMAQNTAIHKLRGKGLELIHTAPFVRKPLMQLGMGWKERT